MKDWTQTYREVLEVMAEEHVVPRTECEKAVRAASAILDDPSLSRTRFALETDCLSLMNAVMGLHREGGTIEGKDLDPLRKDLLLLDGIIESGSGVSVLRAYAEHPGRTAEGRRNRGTLFANVLAGTFHSRLPDPSADLFKQVIASRADVEGSARQTELTCSGCGQRLRDDLSDAMIAWREEEKTSQMSNCSLLHRERCAADATRYRVEEVGTPPT